MTRAAEPSAKPEIRCDGLRVSIGDRLLVDGLDLSVFRGSFLGILGRNGAGKTTTIEMLEGLLEPDAGEVRVLGHTWAEHSRSIRQRIGVQLLVRE